MIKGLAIFFKFLQGQSIDLLVTMSNDNAYFRVYPGLWFTKVLYYKCLVTTLV